MRACLPLVLSLSCVAVCFGTAVQAQQDPPDAPSASAQENGQAVEGTVVSLSRQTLVVRTDDNQYHLFTLAAGTVPAKDVRPGARVSITPGPASENGTPSAQGISVLQPAPGRNAAGHGTTSTTSQAKQLPSVNKATKNAENEARRWHVGGKIGSGLSPELFMFGPQAQFGPFFSSHLIFRPNVEFGFGELTDMYAINAEAAYRLSTPIHGQWTPYIGMGPSFNFISQSASSGTVSFSNFDYKTGFNIFVGGERNKMFVEVKTSLWSDKAPVFRLFVGYNF